MSLLDYITGTPWALHPPVCDAFAQVMQRHFDGVKLTHDELTAALGRDPDADDESREPKTVFEGRTAYVPVRGVLARFSDQVNGSSQPRGRSYEQLVQDLRAAADAKIDRLVMMMTTPGGAVHGVQEVADTVREISASGIEVIAYIDGQCCSGGYYIAAPADRIVAGPNAVVGSIGVISSIMDYSKMAEKQGVRLIVLRSGRYKAIGQVGEKISDEDLAPYRQLIGDMFDAFKGQVSAGRGLSGSALDAVTDGRVWSAERAVGLGLVDAVIGRDAFMASMATGTPIPAATVPVAADPAAEEAAPTPGADTAPATNTEESTMLDAKTLAALKAEHPDAADIIIDLAAEDKSEDEIRAAIHDAAHAKALETAKAELATATEKLSAAEGQIEDLKGQLSAKDGELDELKAKLGQTQDFNAAGAAIDDAGSDGTTATGSPAAGTEDELKARWEAMSPAAKTEWLSYEAWEFAQLNPEACSLDDE